MLPALLAQQRVPVRSYDHHILDSNPELAGQVNSRFNRKHHSGLYCTWESRGDGRFLVDFQPEPVTGGVSKAGTIPVPGDHFARSTIDLGRRDSGTYLVESCLLSFFNDGVNLDHLGKVPVKDSCHIGAVALMTDAKIDHNWFIGLNPLLRCDPVRKGRSAAGSDDRVEGGATATCFSAFVFELGRGFIFGDARPKLGKEGLQRTTSELEALSQDIDFRIIFNRPKLLNETVSGNQVRVGPP